MIGAAVGLLSGGLIGHSMDQEEQARLKTQAPVTYERVEQRQPLSLADVKALAKAGISAQDQVAGAGRAVLQLAAAAGPEFGLANAAALASSART